MRIVLVNWARVADGASNGGGANVYAQQLALELVRRGHEVLWLSSGLEYVADPVSGEPAACKVRRMEDFQSIRVFEVINSPVVAPGPCQAGDPMGEVSCPVLEAEVGRFFQLVQPDIVHFHNIEGFSAGCIAAAKRGAGTWAGARVVFSLHNYHTICPQVYLMQRGRVACENFDGGRLCGGCIDLRPPADERRHRAAFHWDKVEPLPPRPPVGERIKQVFVEPARPDVPLPVYPGASVETFIDTVPRAAKRGMPVPVAADVALGGASLDELRPLSNEVRPDPSMSGELNEFGHRRVAMAGMLSACTRVIAVSEFVHRKFESMGVDPRVLVTMPIGSRMTDAARGALVPPPAFDAANPRPVRAVFMGYNNYYKGLPMLLDALEMVRRELLSRLHLCVYAKAVEDIESRLSLLEPHLAGLSIRSGYRYEDVPRLLGSKDVGLVPSVWWDNGPQTVMEFFACGLPVIGANLGGIPDMVKHGVNGLLHRGNDREDLAKTLEGVLSRPAVLDELRANVRPPRSMGDHTTDMERLYTECLA